MQVLKSPFLPLPRPVLTLLRQHGLHRLLPLDLHVSYHKGAGLVLALLACVHTGAHAHNFLNNLMVQPEMFVRRNNLSHNPEVAEEHPCPPPVQVNLSSLTMADWLLTPHSQLLGLVPGWAFPSGLLLVLLLSVLLMGAVPLVRNSGYFEVFYWTHLTYLPIILLMFLHSTTTWFYLLVPGLLFLLGKLLLIVSSWYRATSTSVLSCSALPSSVTKLVIQRTFDFR